MKTVFAVLFGALMIAILPTLALADGTIPVPPAGFEWLASVVIFLQGIPKVGDVLATVLGVLSLVSGIATVISSALFAALKLPALAAYWLGAPALAAKLEGFYKKAAPWIQYLSMFNVQKKPAIPAPPAPPQA